MQHLISQPIAAEAFAAAIPTQNPGRAAAQNERRHFLRWFNALEIVALAS
jgi:hypothetical protein